MKQAVEERGDRRGVTEEFARIIDGRFDVSSVEDTANARMLQVIGMAEKRAGAHRAFDLFVDTLGAKYDGTFACVVEDRDDRLAFYDFPAEHWRHIRTTNPIESTFASVRLRTTKTKGAGSRMACLTMVLKLALSAQQRWRLLNGATLLADVIKG